MVYVTVRQGIHTLGFISAISQYRYVLRAEGINVLHLIEMPTDCFHGSDVSCFR